MRTLPPNPFRREVIHVQIRLPTKNGNPLSDTRRGEHATCSQKRGPQEPPPTAGPIPDTTLQRQVILGQKAFLHLLEMFAKSPVVASGKCACPNQDGPVLHGNLGNTLDILIENKVL